MKSFLRYWGPAIGWSACIFLFSTGLFSSQKTSHFLFPILEWLFPQATSTEILHAHEFLRKVGHFLEFFILSLFLLRGLRSGRPGWRLSWACAAVALAAGYAALDELHQAFVPTRIASLFDVFIDTSGAATAQFLAGLRARLAPGFRRFLDASSHSL